MVEQKVYTPAFRRMVAKAYYTSNKSHVEIGKEFNASAASVSCWSRLYRHEFLDELSIRQERATLSNLSPTMNKPDLTPSRWPSAFWNLRPNSNRSRCAAPFWKR